MRLILASTSPRRRELLALLGLSFDIEAPAFDECVRDGEAAATHARRCAQGKARAVAVLHPNAVVIGSDTLIEHGHRLLGKPHTRDEARSMLSALGGQQHRIHTAVAVSRVADRFNAVESVTVTVWMKAWSQAQVDRYLMTDESLEKAGGYAIQGEGAELIDRIEGDFTAAVGLPLRAVAALLTRARVSIPVDVEALYRAGPYPNWSRFAPAG